MEDGEIEEGMLMEEDTSVNHQFHPVTMKSPSESLKESKAAVEDTVAKILSIKNENQPKSLLRELVTQMFLHFVNLRQVNRCILLEEDRVKAETECAKAPVDFTTLQLHNLMYEKSHSVKVIKACKDFKSKYPDIELVPEEEFLRDAPEHIKGPEPVKDSSHNLMFKRLNYELHQHDASYGNVGYDSGEETSNAKKILRTEVEVHEGDNEALNIGDGEGTNHNTTTKEAGQGVHVTTILDNVVFEAMDISSVQQQSVATIHRLRTLTDRRSKGKGHGIIDETMKKSSKRKHNDEEELTCVKRLKHHEEAYCLNVGSVEASLSPRRSQRKLYRGTVEGWGTLGKFLYWVI